MTGEFPHSDDASFGAQRSSPHGGQATGHYDTDPQDGSVWPKCQRYWRNLLSRLDLIADDHEIEIVPLERTAPADFKEPVEIRGYISDSPFRIQTELAVTRLILSRLMKEEEAEALSPADAALALEHCISNSLSAVEERLGCEIMLETMDRASGTPGAHALACRITCELGEFPCILSFEDTFIGLALTPVLKAFSDVTGAEKLGSNILSVIIGPVEMGSEDVSALTKEDIVVLAENGDGPVSGYITYRGDALHRVELEGTRFTIMEKLAPGAFGTDQGDDGAAGGGYPQPFNPAGKTVSLGIDMGHREMTLREAKALSTGQSFDFTPLRDGKVRIQERGKTIGTGQLIIQHDMLAVRIKEMY